MSAGTAHSRGTTEVPNGRGRLSAAYQEFGAGRSDLLLPMVNGFAIDSVWDEPAVSSFLTRLGSFSRVIALDARGSGSSSRTAPSAAPALQTWADDLRTVMDDAGSRQAAVLTWGEYSPPALLIAATHPHRVRSLVLVNGYAPFMRNEQTPWALPSQVLPAHLDATRAGWGTGAITRLLAPAMVKGDEALFRSARNERLSATPDFVALLENQAHMCVFVGAARWSGRRSGSDHGSRASISDYRASHGVRGVRDGVAVRREVLPALRPGSAGVVCAVWE